MSHSIDNIRIASLSPLLKPTLLLQELPLSAQASELVYQSRNQVDQILKGQDDRLLVVVGPCSIHDTEAALDYATHLQKASKDFQQDLCILMRVYFEKPRTTIGWKGLINDPNLDESFDINKGLHVARRLLLQLLEMGVPVGSEFLDTIIPQYISDTISWGAIGARTTESQVHRELASGLSMSIGFKNGTDGNIQIAIDAVRSAQHPHHFLSITKMGVPAIVATKGNNSTHIILRGSSQGPNYQAACIEEITQALLKHELLPYLMVDCSHGNSNKEHRRQILVAEDLGAQIAKGNTAICGVMIESNLVEGRQELHSEPLCYGKSVTDACLGWTDTEIVLQGLAQAVQKRRKLKGSV